MKKELFLFVISFVIISACGINSPATTPTAIPPPTPTVKPTVTAEPEYPRENLKSFAIDSLRRYEEDEIEFILLYQGTDTEAKALRTYNLKRPLDTSDGVIDLEYEVLSHEGFPIESFYPKKYIYSLNNDFQFMSFDGKEIGLHNSDHQVLDTEVILYEPLQNSDLSRINIAEKNYLDIEFINLEGQNYLVGLRPGNILDRYVESFIQLDGEYRFIFLDKKNIESDYDYSSMSFDYIREQPRLNFIANIDDGYYLLTLELKQVSRSGPNLVSTSDPSEAIPKANFEFGLSQTLINRDHNEEEFEVYDFVIEDIRDVDADEINPEVIMVTNQNLLIDDQYDWDDIIDFSDPPPFHAPPHGELAQGGGVN